MMSVLKWTTQGFKVLLQIAPMVLLTFFAGLIDLPEDTWQVSRWIITYPLGTFHHLAMCLAVTFWLACSAVHHAWEMGRKRSLIGSLLIAAGALVTFLASTGINFPPLTPAILLFSIAAWLLLWSISDHRTTQD
jgi:cation transport ATPase